MTLIPSAFEGCDMVVGIMLNGSHEHGQQLLKMVDTWLSTLDMPGDLEVVEVELLG